MAFREIQIKLANGTIITKRVDERGIVPNGGTTGQTLGKLSNDDFDVDWITGAGGSSELMAELVATVAVGGVDISDSFPVGTSLEDVLRAILSPYVPPAFTAFYVGCNPDVLVTEVGSTLDVIAAGWTATDDSNGNQPINLHIAGDGFDFDVTDSPTGATGGSTTIRTTAGSNVWTLSGDADHGSPPEAIADKTFSIAWRWRYWFGATTDDSIVDASTLALSLNQSQLLTSKIATFTADANNDTAGKYTWIVYPASFGDLSNIIQNGALPVLTAFQFIDQQNVTNAYGQTIQYNFYRSNADKAFASGVVLTIS